MPSGPLAWAGGPAGRHARSEYLLGAGPLVLAAALPVVVAVLRLTWCLQNGWQGARPFYRMCYSDLANSVQVTELGRGVTAYLDGTIRLDQPPLSGLAMAAIGGWTGGAELLTAQRWFLGVWAALAIGLLALMTLRARSVADHPGADPVVLALAPITALTVLLSPDILGVALATFGILSWSARRPLLAGVLLALATLARSYPVLIVVVILFFLWRAEVPVTRARAVRLLGGFLVTLVLVWLGLFAGHRDVALQGWSSWWHAAAGLGSPWYLPTLGSAALPSAATSVLAAVGWAAALVLGALVVTGGTRPPTVAAASLVVVAVVLVTGKSFPIQSSLWLVPLVALAGLRWRDVLLWSAAEGAHFVALWLYVGGLSTPTKGLPAGWYLVFLALRLTAVGWLARQAWVAAPRVPVSEPDGIPVPPDRDGIPVPPDRDGIPAPPDRDGIPAPPAPASAASSTSLARPTVQ